MEEKIREIKYIKVQHKIYKVKRISFYYFQADVVETNLREDDIPKDELLKINPFTEFRIKIVDDRGGID